ncbi:SDR family NAD(P)-dependent oxidoreductase [Streptomyces sp. NPDC018019]|uniref:SDR family NAD(P)-dependent oxidoreductase n=1 Tax=Streptomyces sp. NPDC018019 TaxID=3365030 RepID=UPI0037AE07FE
MSAPPAPRPDDVAVIGLALRFPGSDTLAELFGHLAAGRSLITEVPPERWSKESHFGEPRSGTERTNSIWGGFVEHADRFDASFFSISPREAESMDPQQRFALELAWHAIEDAGYRASAFAGTRTGVFMGVCHADYAEMMEREKAPTDVYFPTGTAYSVIANRVSYFFDFQGPSITNDTACSSSLVSVYEAVSALRNGECGLALAGGVNLCWSPKHFVAFSQAGMLSRTGRSRAFDQDADGYVRGEGGAVLVLKPLARALADGDQVHAVIKGIATNHGGRTSSLTVTNPAAQADLIEGLYKGADIPPDSVTYIEAHGPGTPVGDPIEVIALKRAFRNLHAAYGTEPRPESCGIGSVKTNIGHLEGAAGVAGMVKVIGALACRTLPATAGFGTRNKLIKLDGSPFHIVRDTRPWDAPPPGPDGRPAPRRAGVSSFGFGGTNAHVVLEEHLPAADGERAPEPAGPHLVPLSAKTPERLRAVAGALLDHLREQEAGDGPTAPLRPVQRLADIAYTLRTGREPMAARVAFLVSDRAELVTALGSFVDGTLADTAVHTGAGTPADAATGLLESATRWVEGGTDAWAAQDAEGDGGPRRVRLPGYPFARERHWFRAGAPGQTALTGTDAALHPLLHRNTSSLFEQRYTSAFTGDEPFLASHQVRGARVLPAAAYVEMARAAVSAATGRAGRPGTPVRLRDIAWLRPLTVDDAPAEVHVGLFPGDGDDERDGATVALTVYTGPSAHDPSAVIHCWGTAETAAPEEPAALDLDALRAACGTRQEPADAYAALRGQGLEYGPGMRGMAELRLGDEQVLARIEQPSSADEGTGHVLPPSVLDAALQATLVLMAHTAGGPADGPAIPFTLDRVDIFRPCSPETWAWARPSGDGSGPDTFDIDLCDAEGAVCARLRGLVQRTAPGSAPGKSGGTAADGTASRVVTGTCRWVDAPLAADAAGTATVHGFLAGRAADHATAVASAAGCRVTALPAVTADRLADGTDAVLGLLVERMREVLGNKPDRPHRFVVLVDDRVPRHFHAAVTGLFRTAALENPLVGGHLVRVAGLDGAPPERIARILAEEGAGPHGAGEIRRAADGTRQEWRPVDIALGDGPQVPPLKEGGVYWVTGGLGGLGQHLARYFARRPGVTVVLSGRAAPDAGEAALAALRDAGVAAHYLPVDVARKDDVERAVRDITREHGRLDGVVHAAGVLHDAYLLHKDAADVPRVTAPKVRGVLHLDAATRDLGLDFFVVFSSVAGVYGNAGQADYAAANAFLDAFAHHRRALADIGERSGRTVAVSWPLWADGGMTADAVTRAAMRAERGWEPLPTEDGLRVLGRLLDDAPAHVVVAFGADATVAPERRLPAADPAPAPAGTAPALADDELLERTTSLLAQHLGEVLHHDPATMQPTVNLVEYGIDSLSILEMTARLEALFGPLPKTVFFEYLTIEGVAGYFAETHRDTLLTVLGAADGPGQPETAAETPRVAGPSAPRARFARPAPARADAAPRPAPARRDRHDIAVIGISGRYPGADTLDELWTLLEAGRHTFEEVPRDRWDHDAIYSPDRSVPGKSAIRTGTFLRDIDMFDPRYFRISKRDAELMSPEVRLFLQTGVEALEDAGYSRETLQREYDGDVGVLVGAMSNHYGLHGFQNSLLRGSPASGSYTGTLPNMLSYFYGFTGPSIFLDTMCSGSSTCVHQAVQMLRAGECRMAVAGGVNLLLHPYNLVTSSHEHFTTATSDVIRSFGLGADGTILGEGVGAVVLKPLADAERDGDHVYAVIKGTALSNAGARNGFTVPSPHAQARAVEKAVADAGIDARTVSYVEGHGSGTSLGDPIEVKALTTAFRKQTEDSGFCALGSVKSNMGHLLHAAGMIGFAKVVLQLAKRTLVPSLHSAELNPDIDFAGTPFRVQRELGRWEPAVTEDGGRTVVHPRRAGLTSIGAGGMNSHIVIEEYDPDAAGPHDTTDGRDELFVFSAMTDTALDTALARFRTYLEQADPAALPSIAHTLRVGKNELPRRWAFFARDVQGALEAVDRRLAGDRDLDAALATDDPRAADARELATAWTGGRSVDWSRLTGTRRLRRVPLPAYPFERVRCWVPQEDAAPSVLAPLALRDKLHPFLGRNESDLDGLRYGLDVHLDDLGDWGYRRDKQPSVVPAFVIDTALAAAKVSGFAADPLVRGLRLPAPVPWATTERLVTTFIEPAGEGAATGAVFAQDATGARTLVAAFEAYEAEPPARLPESGTSPAGLRADAVHVLSAADVRAELAEGGLDHPALHSGVAGAYRLRDGRLVLDLAVPELRRDTVRRNVTIAPHVLAAVTQGLQLDAKHRGLPHWQEARPHRIAEVRVFGAAGDGEVAHVVLLPGSAVSAGDRPFEGGVQLLDRTGAVLAEFSGITCDEDGVPAEPPVVRREPRQRSARQVAAGAPGDGGGDGGGAGDGLTAFVVDELRVLAGGILKYEPEELDAHTGFDAFGFDSISFVTFARRIEERFGAQVTPAAFFDVNTFDTLARHLLAESGEPVRAAYERSRGGESARTAPASGSVPVTGSAPDRGSAPDTGPAPAPEPVRPADPWQPIAVIGAAGRFPGAPDLDTYWANLVAGRDSVAAFPLDRYDATYRRIAEAADFPRHAGVLDDVDAFDAEFFRVYPREAELMDPQHRLALETVWSALEDSAYTPADLPRNTGLFLGVSGSDYATLLTAYGVEPDAFTSTGNAHSMLANRISYVLDLRGPSEPVDTACSSSLVAVHRAVEAIRSGACEAAVAGGVNLLLSVDTFVSAHRAGMLSADGRCKTFARDADGYVRGEGVGAVVLKPLAAAERDGDAILAVLRGSAENHGGRANSLTAPNADAQAELVTAAMRGTDPDTVGYIEAHGTGTALGDPVEVRALRTAFRRLGATGRGTCGLGSVKTNIGHLEAAAGIAGLLKVILALRHGVLPATLHCREINPYIELDGGPFRIVRETGPWPRPRGSGGRPAPRRAGVSSFGFGGANCHVVVEEYVQDDAGTEAREAGRTVDTTETTKDTTKAMGTTGSTDVTETTDVLVPLSARTEHQLTEAAGNLLGYLENTAEPASLRSIAWTLQVGRQAMAERVGWVVRSHDELAGKLRAFLDGERSGGDAAQNQALARWTEGEDIDWRALYGPRVPKRAHLPTYPFARQRFWIPGTRVESAPDDGPAIGTTLLTPRWTPRPAPSSTSADSTADHRVVILCGALASARGAVERRVPGVRCFAVESAKERLDSRFRDVSQQVFEIVRGLVADAPDGSTLLQVVTPADGDETVNLALTGLLRTATLEHSRIAAQLIAFEGTGTDDAVAAAVVDDARDTDADLVRHRGDERSVRAWHPAAPPADATDTPWRAGGGYLITGGAGGIGAAVARRIAQDVADPAIVLVGRSPRDARIDALLAELRAAGALARYESADLSRWEEVRHLLGRVRDGIGEIAGIVHAAGVLRDASLVNKTAEDWEEVLAPKTDGLVHLDRATRHDPLDFFLTFSSGAAVTGNPGQADYATANAFLDAFAALRDARVAVGERAGRTLSIAWPLWKDGGMTVDEGTLAYLWRSRGLAPMETADGLAALTRAWRLGTEQVWVYHGDAARVPAASCRTAAAEAPARAASPARTAAPAQSEAPVRPATPALPEAPAPVDGRLARETLRLLAALFARVTKLPARSVDADAELGAMGLESIMIVQLNKELSTVFGEVPATLFYEFPTLRAVAGHLAAEHTAAARAWAGEPATAAPEPPAGARTDRTPAPYVSPAPDAPADREPIAVIGLSGRYPHAADLAEFWANLKAGRDCVDEIPADRWPLDGFFEPDREQAVATGRSYSKWGGFLDDFAAFDPLHFRIAPRDAYAMDPQERLFLQAAWQVFEDAGYSREEIARRHGKRVGVFAGVTKTGHGRHGAGRLPSGETVVPALSFASLSARTSYVLDLCGPSLTIDTMCSASLTAVHEACEHLYRGACEMAVAGGVNLYLHPLDYIELCRSTMLSTDARCRSFGSGGDGFVPGEGVGCVLLKPLSRALADGDHIRAVIRGTGINHGGRSNGYTVPNPRAQADLLRDTMARAGVAARDISFVEAHGTGTELGDPVEIKGLTSAFEQDTADRQFCAIGSVKSVIGHLEAAAGIAGLTKAVLQLQHRELAPSLHAEQPNPNIAFQKTPFSVQREPAPWQPPSGRPRIAAVSSFGAGGSNAHVIVEEFGERYGAGAARAVTTGRDQLFVLSARTPGQLRGAAERLAAFLDSDGGGDTDPADLAFTLQTGREAMTERLAVVAASARDLHGALRAYLNGEETVPGLHRGTAGRIQGAFAELAADDDLQELLVERWIRAGKLDKLAALWADGVPLDWRVLHGAATPRRVPLPTYPFARDRYWIGDLEPVRTEPVRTEPVRTEPVRTEPVRTEPVRTEPNSGPADPQPSAIAPTAAVSEPPAPGPLVPEPLDERVARVVRDKLARALAMGDDEIDGALAFADYGLDSILGVRLVHELNEALGLDLSTSVIYDHSSADRLTAHLLADHRDAITRTGTPEPAAAAVSASESSPVSTPASATDARPRGARQEPAGARPPIAIVGMSGRFAGSDTLDDLWEHLVNGDELVTEATRWDLSGPDPADAARRCTRGGFLDRIDAFDPLFFNISGVEAATMDPQQRLLLEEAWKALEDAGYAGRQLSERRCGVYVGCWNGDYAELVGEHAPAQAFWGNTASFIPSRVSYFLNLKGPAVAVDTSCSSSLVALDLACKDLWSGETTMALAGGVFVQSTPRLYELAGRANMLSPTGRCHTFDHRADGFVPGEGVGVLVLKRLDDALADGDHVHGVIRGCGTNHDGATNGITAPSSVSQESLLREVYDGFGIDPGHIQLVEAHGTGTELGDPIEFRALTRAFRAGTDKTGYCAVGSVKTNLGHTQFAAGVAGVLKILLALKHRQIPASLHFEKANEAIPLDGSPFYPSTRTHTWEALPGVPRCGAVSSFGASGTNAHVVIEEAPPVPRSRPRPPVPAHLVVLSAHSRDQLAEQAARLAAHCRRTPSLDVGDLAHTLVAGREHFAHRFACVVRDRDELLRALDEGLGGPRAFTGGPGAPREDTAALAERGTACLRQWRDGATGRTDAAFTADLKLLAECYAGGAELDYGTLFTPGAYLRVPLPTYPFARESHWATDTPPARPAALPAKAPGIDAAQAAAPAPGHPMIGALEPVPGTAGALRAEAVLTGTESFLRDHLVRGRRVLPGVAHLEMARETARHALGADATAPLRMRDITWVQPLVADGAPAGAEVLAEPVADGTVAFRVTSRGTPPGAEPAVCSEGRVSRCGTPRPARTDLAALRASCPTTVSAERIGAALVAMGITHGPSLRAIGAAYAGDGVVLAELAVPPAADRPATPYVLHPALMDSAVQASIALQLAQGGAAQETVIPFALEQLDLYAPCTDSMWAVVRVAGDGAASPLSKLDIDLLDTDGAVCVRMTGYTSRRVKEPVPSLFAPVWEPLPAAVPDGAADAAVPSRQDRVLIVGGGADQRAAVAARHPRATAWPLAPSAPADEVASFLAATGPVDHLLWIAPDTAPEPTDAAGFVAAQETGVVAAHRMIKALLRTGHDARPLGITLVTRRSLPTHAAEDIRPAHAGLHGLFGSLGREYTNWTVRRVDLDGPADLPEETGAWFDDIAALPAHSYGDTWARRAGQWLVRRWSPCDAGPERPAPYREGGVYVVIGGAGGVGTAWTQHMVEEYGAHVIWIGRSPHDASMDAKLRAVHGRGDVHYIRADAADPAALRRAHAEIKARHPQIHGVVQAALVLRDQSFARMDETALRAGLAAKVDVSAAMAEVFAAEPLDFAVFFSSVQSFTTAAGQGNYAAGCTFADAYAHQLSLHWACPVKVLNWGWWGSLGSASSDYHRRRMTGWGFTSIEPPEAMAALGTLLGGPQPQLGFVKLSRPDALEAVDPATRTTVYDRSPAARVTVGAADAPADDGDTLRAVADWRRTERDPLLARMLRGHLEALGVLGPDSPAPGGGVTRAEAARLGGRAGILDRYTTWLEHALRVLPDAVPPLATLDREWDDRRAAWSADPDKKAELELVDATLRALPDILTGRTRPTDILFPRGSVALVEGCYRDNRVADTYNRALAGAALDIVRQRLAQDPDARLRILEIGAGTGGTSVGLFAALRPYRDRIETYTYTDLSKAFLNHARASYGTDAPYLSTTRFDAEQPLAGQGIEAGGYDLVIAANVLHATRDTRNTLRNAKAALRDGGWLLLNELVAFDIFSHLTFGLLEGWWLFEDAPLRIPGSPALSPESWRDVLHGEGFREVVFVLPQARALGQQIIAAESDGIARQRVAGAAHRPVTPAAETVRTTDGAVTAPEPVRTEPVRTEPVRTEPERPAAPAPAPARTEADRAGTLTAYLRDKAAETLGIPAERIDAASPLSTYGMDSILVLQLTNALREDLGEVSSTLLFDAESVDQLCAHFLTASADRVDALVARLRPEPAADGAAPVPAPVSASAPTPAEPAAAAREAAPAPHSVCGLFQAASRNGSLQQGSELLAAAAQLRPRFTAAGGGREPEILRLADGTEQPALVCLPSLIAPTGPYQYVKFAAALRGRREVWTAAQPGYGTGDALPQTLDAAATAQADALLRRFAGRPFALAAYSSGAWPAHEVVRRLESAGSPPAALVLLDSPGSTGDTDLTGESLCHRMAGISRLLLDRFPHLPLDDDQLTAMAWYARLLDGWRPGPATTPTLFVAARTPVPQLLGDGRRPTWEAAHTRVEVAGDHFSMLDEHAATTALAVHRWLTEHLR